MVQKTVGVIDLDWGDCKDHKICGDMGFSFCDQDDTRNENIEELKRSTEEYCLGDEAVQNCDTLKTSGNDAFAIYSVCEEVIELDEEGDWLWSGTRVSIKPLVVYVCATKEEGGWIEEDSYFKDKNIEIKYRDE